MSERGKRNARLDRANGLTVSPLDRFFVVELLSLKMNLFCYCCLCGETSEQVWGNRKDEGDYGKLTILPHKEHVPVTFCFAYTIDKSPERNDF